MSNRRSRLFSRAFLLSDRCILRITIEMRGIQNWSSYREELLVFAILLSTQSVYTTTITLSFRVDPCWLDSSFWAECLLAVESISLCGKDLCSSGEEANGLRIAVRKHSWRFKARISKGLIVSLYIEWIVLRRGSDSVSGGKPSSSFEWILVLYSGSAACFPSFLFVFPETPSQCMKSLPQACIHVYSCLSKRCAIILPSFHLPLYHCSIYLYSCWVQETLSFSLFLHVSPNCFMCCPSYTLAFIVCWTIKKLWKEAGGTAVLHPQSLLPVPVIIGFYLRR